MVGVGILVDKVVTEQVVEVMRVNDRMIAIKLVLGGFTFNIISALHCMRVGRGSQKALLEGVG